MSGERHNTPHLEVLEGKAGGGGESFDMFADYSQQLASGAAYLPFFRSLIDRYGSSSPLLVPGKSTVPVSIGSTLLPLERTYAWAHINTLSGQEKACLEVQFPKWLPSADNPYERWSNIRYAITPAIERVARKIQDYDLISYNNGRPAWRLSDMAPTISIAVTNLELTTVYNLLDAAHAQKVPGALFLAPEPNRAVIDALQLPYAQ